METMKGKLVMLRACLASIIALLLYGIATAAMADTTLHYTAADGSGERVYEFKGDRMRVNNDDQNTTMIYDRSADAMTLIDHDDRSYAVVTAETRKQVRQSMSDAQQQAMQDMRERLSKLPADQRKAIMDSMKKGLHAGGTGLSKAMEVHVEKTGETATVNGYHCEIIVTRVANSRTRACVASNEEVGMPANVSATMAALSESVRKLSGGLLQGLGASLPTAPEMGGTAVRTRSNDETTYTLSELGTEPVPASAFQVPDGYEKQEMQVTTGQ